MPNDEFFQALWEFRHDFIDRYAASVRIKEAIVTLAFCDEHGRQVTLRNEHGKRILRFTSKGAYRSAADYYDAQPPEPQILTTANLPRKTVPFSPI